MLKLAVVLLLLAIIGSLFSGLFFLYRDRASGQHMATVGVGRAGEARELFGRATREAKALGQQDLGAG